MTSFEKALRFLVIVSHDRYLNPDKDSYAGITVYQGEALTEELTQSFIHEYEKDFDLFNSIAKKLGFEIFELNREKIVFIKFWSQEEILRRYVDTYNNRTDFFIQHIPDHLKRK